MIWDNKDEFNIQTMKILFPYIGDNLNLSKNLLCIILLNEWKLNVAQLWPERERGMEVGLKLSNN